MDLKHNSEVSLFSGCFVMQSLVLVHFELNNFKCICQSSGLLFNIWLFGQAYEDSTITEAWSSQLVYIVYVLVSSTCRIKSSDHFPLMHFYIHIWGGRMLSWIFHNIKSCLLINWLFWLMCCLYSDDDFGWVMKFFKGLGAVAIKWRRFVIAVVLASELFCPLCCWHLVTGKYLWLDTTFLFTSVQANLVWKQHMFTPKNNIM